MLHISEFVGYITPIMVEIQNFFLVLQVYVHISLSPVSLSFSLTFIDLLIMNHLHEQLSFIHLSHDLFRL